MISENLLIESSCEGISDLTESILCYPIKPPHTHKENIHQTVFEKLILECEVE
jgi:hypothetical protein